jgi:hypothetical protein
MPYQNKYPVVSVEWIMLPVSLPPILRWAGLCGYALLVLLGHGGWHLALGEADCGSHASHVGHTHPQKSTCTHQHCHHHPVKGTQHPEPSPTPHAPHDSDHCAICAVFSAPLTTAEKVEVSGLESEVNCVVEWYTEMVSTSQETLPCPRGPPAC